MYSCTQRAPAKWLCSIGRMVIPQHTETFRTLEASEFRETHPSRSDLRVTLRLRRSDTLPARILYWAAAPRDGRKRNHHFNLRQLRGSVPYRVPCCGLSHFEAMATAGPRAPRASATAGGGERTRAELAQANKPRRKIIITP